MAERNKPHLLVPTPPQGEPFTLSSGVRGKDRQTFSLDKHRHGSTLKTSYEEALAPTDNAESRDGKTESGTYLTFVSFPGFELALESLDSRRSGSQPELVAVSFDDTETGLVQRATVFVPDGKKEYFLTKLDSYIETSGAEKTKHADMVEMIASIQRATIRELWTDSPDEFPVGEEIAWWEVWLRKRDGNEVNRFTEFARTHQLLLSNHYLGFGNRTVILVRASVDELGNAIASLDDFAELRRPHDVTSFIATESATDQADWVNDLLGRLEPASVDAPAACLLDTGVQQSHPLLKDSLHIADAHTINAARPLRDINGHGTEMAGLALYGDLASALASSLPIRLLHRLESVKCLEITEIDESQEELKDPLGAITARAIDRPEIQAPRRKRVFSIATTSPRHVSAPGVMNKPHDPGKPTLWSSTIDALAAGCAIDDTDPKLTYLVPEAHGNSRLFVVSAGNIRDVRGVDDHLDRSDLEPVEDPAQSWNSLTVGAFTNLDDMSTAISDFSDYVPLAPRGELAPTSRTSVVFNKSKWPVKPDVVAEGGNVARNPDGSHVDTPENLAILTTRLHGPGMGALTTTRDTSAAAAQVAAIAADVMATYPNFWPETVRALVIHSAQWTAIMEQHLNAVQLKARRSDLLRRYGMGVPDQTRALKSATDALTLISQSTIRPFEHIDGRGNEGRVREMNLHDLPWPSEVLESLGATQVRMRVTLSYFIEPNPSSLGWSGRYIYPSYGLRFAVRRASESTESFRKRINTRTREEGEKAESTSNDSQWFFGADQHRSSGSLHTDIWEGKAADLARRGVVAVYPVAGWWKSSKKKNRSEQGVRYSLVVSIETPGIDVDVWTPVSQAIAVPISVGT